MERFQELVTITAGILAGFYGMLVQEISYIAAPARAAAPTTEVLFIGDMMFDRSIRVAMQSYGSDFIFSCISTELAAADLTVGNLEGPITPYPSKSVGSAVGSHDNFVFTFPEYVAPLLHRQNVRVVSLGNNHIYNFGEEGVDSTVRALEAAKVGYFGEPGGYSVSEVESNGVPLTLIGYNEFDEGSTPLLAINQITDAREKKRIPVVFAHWGDEYKPATEREISLAHKFIDAGAELVIGAHPHVIQASEIYKGKHIYYSLGNFIFDQYWNEAVSTGLTVRVTFNEQGVFAVHESKVSLGRDRRTCPVKEE